MSRVVFLIDFTIEGKVELASRASISKAEALKIDGLTSTGEDTIIRLSDPNFEEAIASKPASQARPGRPRKKQQPRPSVIPQDRQSLGDDDDQEDGDADMQQLQDIEIDLEDKLIEDQMNGDESDEDNLNEEMDLEDEDSFDNDDQIIMNFGGRKMTKRQLGYLEEPMQLPNKATRQKKKLPPEAMTQQDVLKKLEKEQRRRQHMRKQIEAQKMQTVEKILNETGRKQRQRNERENKQRAEKENKIFRQLRDVPKIVTKWTRQGCTITTYDTLLFPPEATVPPRMPMRPDCYLCGCDGKYKVGRRQMVCSLECYRKWKETKDSKEAKGINA